MQKSEISDTVNVTAETDLLGGKPCILFDLHLKELRSIHYNSKVLWEKV